MTSLRKLVILILLSLKTFEQTKGDLIVTFKSLRVVTLVIRFCSWSFNQNLTQCVRPVIGLLALLLCKVSANELNEDQIVSVNVSDHILNRREDLDIVVLKRVHGLNEAHDDDEQHLLLSDQLLRHLLFKEQGHLLNR